MSKVIYDAEATVLLQAAGSAPVTSTTSTSAVDFEMSTGGTFGIAVHVAAVNATGDNTFELSFVGQDSAGANDVTVATLPITSTGEYFVPLDGDTVAKIAGDSTAKVLATATLAGTGSPSLTYSAWISPTYGANRP